MDRPVTKGGGETAGRPQLGVPSGKNRPSPGKKRERQKTENRPSKRFGKAPPQKHAGSSKKRGAGETWRKTGFGHAPNPPNSGARGKKRKRKRFFWFGMTGGGRKRAGWGKRKDSCGANDGGAPARAEVLRAGKTRRGKHTPEPRKGPERWTGVRGKKKFTKGGIYAKERGQRAAKV